MEYDLIPIHDSRKSFYKKAIVISNEHGDYKLKSYSTIVCMIDRNNKAIVYGTYSRTTLRHIKEFLKQKGFKADSENQILQDYENDEPEPEKGTGILNTIKMVCAFGDIINTEQKEKNDWKKRMINAGLENRGISFPDDWETLTEEEKANRLDGALNEI